MNIQRKSEIELSMYNLKEIDTFMWLISKSNSFISMDKKNPKDYRKNVNKNLISEHKY